jgi:hypothetical protein
MMNRKKLLIPVVLSVLVVVLMLSGCVMPTWVRTTSWVHTGADDGTSVELRGSLLTKDISDWNLFIVWDDESHTSWEDYEYKVEPDGYLIRTKSFAQYYIELDGLVRTQKYYFRAVGELLLRARSEWYDGFEIAFTPGLPVVKTKGVTEVTADSAVIHGYLERMSGATSCMVWFEYDEQNPDGSSPDVYRNKTAPQQMTKIGPFSSIISGLNTNTTYCYRAFASNDVGEDYSIQQEFITAKE